VSGNGRIISHREGCKGSVFRSSDGDGDTWQLRKDVSAEVEQKMGQVVAVKLALGILSYGLGMSFSV
jgi:hypothetical protein